MTPHKGPARIAFIRQLTSKNQQLLALNAELAAKIEQLSKRYAMDHPLAFMHVIKTSAVAPRAGLREVLPPPEYIGGFDRGYFGAFRSFETCLRKSVKGSMRLSLPQTASTLLPATWRIPPLSEVCLQLAS